MSSSASSTFELFLVQVPPPPPKKKKPSIFFPFESYSWKRAHKFLVLLYILLLLAIVFLILFCLFFSGGDLGVITRNRERTKLCSDIYQDSVLGTCQINTSCLLFCLLFYVSLLVSVVCFVMAYTWKLSIWYTICEFSFSF